MRKKLFFLLLTVNFAVAQNYNGGKSKINDQTFKGVLEDDDFDEFKTFIQTAMGLEEIAEDNSFLINYKQPEGDCFYNQYSNQSDCDNSFFEDNVYNQVSVNDKTIKLYFQHKTIPVKKAKNCETKFDVDSYLYNRFFEKSNLCFGLIIVNSKGEFRSYMGEYIYRDVQNFLNQLKM